MTPGSKEKTNSLNHENAALKIVQLNATIFYTTYYYDKKYSDSEGISCWIISAGEDEIFVLLLLLWADLVELNVRLSYLNFPHTFETYIFCLLLWLLRLYLNLQTIRLLYPSFVSLLFSFSRLFRLHNAARGQPSSSLLLSSLSSFTRVSHFPAEDSVQYRITCIKNHGGNVVDAPSTSSPWHVIF